MKYSKLTSSKFVLVRRIKAFFKFGIKRGENRADWGMLKISFSITNDIEVNMRYT
jgi:hypothetical protein